MKPFAPDFDLFPLESVPAWGEPPNLELHWYGLTGGTYELLVDGHSLHRSLEGPPEMDYLLAQVWQDFHDVLPEVLAPIPPALAERVSAVDEWRGWLEHAWDLETPLELFAVATSWWDDRAIDAMYLRGAPRMHVWRTGDRLNLTWRASTEGIWAEPEGEATMHVSAFVDGLVAFDHRLMTEMRERIESIEHHWTRPDVRIDKDLRREHAERATSLAKAMREPRAPPHSWDEVMTAIAAIDEALR